MRVGGCSLNPSNRSLVPIPRTESRDPIPRTVRPSAAGAAPGGGLLGLAARPGGGVGLGLWSVLCPFGVCPSLYIGARGMASTLEAIRTLHP